MLLDIFRVRLPCVWFSLVFTFIPLHHGFNLQTHEEKGNLKKFVLIILDEKQNFLLTRVMFFWYIVLYLFCHFEFDDHFSFYFIIFLGLSSPKTFVWGTWWRFYRFFIHFLNQDFKRQKEVVENYTIKCSHWVQEEILVWIFNPESSPFDQKLHCNWSN